MEEPTLEQIIDGFRGMPGSMQDRADAIASYLSSRFGSKVAVAVERIDGTVAHFIQSAMIDDFESFRLNGYMGDPYRFERSQFTIDLVRAD
ncbi:hypothetical protein R69746_07739 [Paraburkholderia aspalathi]|uniref:hypothetical protein n=1 Tax=Paraburkholderia aspalathi TaxID=1324617 RepID=UPI00190DD05E|nr:hypothetical protein [Paraburkholderia aspalathi]MBK3843724.1 hypothetical protein [Paraburkholderia aspalathi]CAE6859470.1 hypothetical protein R69746_07739 [Paraburkholderia aspalathi]